MAAPPQLRNPKANKPAPKGKNPVDSVWGFISKHVKGDYKTATKVYKALDDYANDRLWGLVPYHLLPEGKKKERDRQPSMMIDWKGASLYQVIQGLIKSGSGSITGGPGTKWSNEILDKAFPFWKVSKNTKGISGKILKVGPEEDPEGMFAWYDVPDPIGWNAKDVMNLIQKDIPIYRRRPFVGLPEEASILVGPKGGEHYQVGRYASRYLGYDPYTEAAPGVPRVEYGTRGGYNTRIQNASLPQHGWIFRQSPNELDLEVGSVNPQYLVDDAGRPSDYAKVLYRFLKSVIEGGEFEGNVVPKGSYFEGWGAQVPGRPVPTFESDVPISTSLFRRPEVVTGDRYGSWPYESVRQPTYESVQEMSPARMSSYLDWLAENVPPGGVSLPFSVPRGMSAPWGASSRGVIPTSPAGPYGYNTSEFMNLNQRRSLPWWLWSVGIRGLG